MGALALVLQEQCPPLRGLLFGFERQTGIHPEATDHSRKSDAKDVQIVVEVVLKTRILAVIDQRQWRIKGGGGGGGVEGAHPPPNIWMTKK